MSTLTRSELSDEAANAAHAIVDYLRERHGRRFAVMVWLAEHDTEETAYAANVETKPLSQALRELADRLDAGLTSDPPGPRANA